MKEYNLSCLACGKTNLLRVLDLGDHPLANSFLKSKDEIEQKYPLCLDFCNSCSHLQLSHTINPELLFKNYIYVSGTSNTGLEHFKNFVEFTKGYNPKAKSVLDIACNDGSQLDFYKDSGFETFGIDPAENLYQISSKKHNIVCGFLTEKNISQFDRKFDIIVAQNVFAHTNKPLEFLLLCKQYLNDNGCIFIQTSQCNMIKNNEFDTIYHEHISFFSVNSFNTLAKKSGLSLIDVKKADIHGTSYVFVLSNSKTDKEFFDEDPITKEMLIRYAKNCKTIINNLKIELEKYKEKGYTLIGFGAAAKGNTVLNYGDIFLDYIIDENPLKQNLYTPGTRIPIRDISYLQKETNKKIIIIPLAWNFFDEIKCKVKKLNKNVEFIKYFPELNIEK